MDPPSPDDSTALVVLIPEADSAIGAIRARHDPSAQRGMAAHVTIVYPFMPEGAWTTETEKRLASVFRTLEPFDVKFRHTRRLAAGTLVLEPEPSEPFADLTRAVELAFPAFPPYGGRFTEVVPHLTLADGASPAAVDEADIGHADTPPFGTRVAEVAVVVKRGSMWRFRRRFTLGAAAPEPEFVLRGAGADEVRLAVLGYQFGAPDAGIDWVQVRARFAHAGRRWRAIDPCLTAAQLPELARWLRQTGDGVRRSNGIEFIEPVIRFLAYAQDDASEDDRRAADDPRSSSPADPAGARPRTEAAPPGYRACAEVTPTGRVPGAIRVRIEVRHAFHPDVGAPLPPRFGNSPAPGHPSWEPYAIDLDMLPETLLEAARDAEAICRRWPDRARG